VSATTFALLIDWMLPNSPNPLLVLREPTGTSVGHQSSPVTSERRQATAHPPLTVGIHHQ
jgi:hypothetical protein